MNIIRVSKKNLFNREAKSQVPLTQMMNYKRNRAPYLQQTNSEFKNLKIRMIVKKIMEKIKHLLVRIIQRYPLRKLLHPSRVNPILNQLILRKPKKNPKLQITLSRSIQILKKKSKRMRLLKKKLVLLRQKFKEVEIIKMQKAKTMALLMIKMIKHQKFNREQLIRILKKNQRK